MASASPPPARIAVTVPRGRARAGPSAAVPVRRTDAAGRSGVNATPSHGRDMRKIAEAAARTSPRASAASVMVAADPLRIAAPPAPRLPDQNVRVQPRFTSSFL
jgi:hypothetical protein